MAAQQTFVWSIGHPHTLHTALGLVCFFLFSIDIYFLIFSLHFLLKPLLTFFLISTFSLLVYWNHYFFLSIFLLKSLLSLHLSIQISTFSVRFYSLFTFVLKRLLSPVRFSWNLYPLLIFLLKRHFLSLHFSIEVSTFSSLVYSNLYFLCAVLLTLHFCIETATFPCAVLLKSLPTLDFSIETTLSFSPLFYWSLYFLFTCLFKSLLSLCGSTHSSLLYRNCYFPLCGSLEISTHSWFFYWNDTFFLSTFLLKSLLSLHWSIQFSILSSLAHSNLYFLCGSIEISTFFLYLSIELPILSLLF